jgi:hypothetical protein
MAGDDAVSVCGKHDGKLFVVENEAGVWGDWNRGVVRVICRYFC